MSPPIRYGATLGALAVAIALVLILAPGDPDAAATSAANLVDSDGDSLPDSWETGVTPRGLDLRRLGADPMHKDIFLEIDYLKRGYRNELTCKDLNTIRRMFAQAPVSNPDGQRGIRVHIDAGLQCGRNDYGLGGSNVTITRPESLVSDCNHKRAFENAFDSGLARITDKRENVFHHMLFTAYIDKGCYNLFGLARGISARQYLVAVETHGARRSPHVYSPTLLDTVLHLWGHGLGLTHGGAPGDHDGDKPNHFSLMSYLHDRLPLANGRSLYDFQRFEIPALDESALDETAGLRTSDARRYRGAKFCPGGPVGWYLDIEDGPADRNIDWDCDSAYETSVEQDINLDGEIGIIAATENEWENLVYSGGAGGRIGPGNPSAREDSGQPLDPASEAAAGASN